jgi:hypothetical protein
VPRKPEKGFRPLHRARRSVASAIARILRALAGHTAASRSWSGTIMRIHARQLPIFLLALGTLMFTQSFDTLKASPVATRVSDYKLANGLH